MSKTEESLESNNVYRVEGFTCANCAGKFEKNVKELPGVQDAKVNFGASKIAVYGDATIEELEKAGAFENLKVTPEKAVRESRPAISEETKEPFYKKHSTLLYSSLFIVFGYVSQYVNGEENLITLLLFATSILVGGWSLLKTGLQNLTRFELEP